MATNSSGSRSSFTPTPVSIVAFIWFLVGTWHFGHCTPCTSSDTLGSSNVNSLASSVSGGSGKQYLMTDIEFISGCCGYVAQWQIYAARTGDIQFQVWRPVATSYQLVGENTATIASTGIFTVTVATGSLINIQANDVVGWYTPGTDNVAYKGGGVRNDNNYIETMAQPTVGQIVAFSSATADRTYALYAALSSTPPTFGNLDASVVFPKSSVGAGTLVYTANATAFGGGAVTYSVQSSSPSNDFSVDASTGQVTATTSSVTVATYAVVVRATDACGSTVDGTLSVDITNLAPEIHSLPDVVQVSESAVDETFLHAVNTTDPDGDTVTCSVSSSPSGPFITKFTNSGGGTLTTGIYTETNPNFNYAVANSYEVTATCADTSGYSVTAILYVYLVKNQVPVISNLQNATSIYSNLTLSSNIFSILASDAEGDQMAFALTCVIPGASPCPFSVYSDGSIVLTTSLAGTSVNVYEADVSVSDIYTSSGTHRLTVFVVDLNVAPYLTNLPDSIQVTEDTAVGTVVFDAAVYDDNGDSSFTFSASFSPASSAGLFDVNASTGEVTIASSLNYLTQANNYTIAVVVNDGQAPSTSQTLRIETVEVNQAPVLYQQNYKVEAAEGSAGTSFPDPDYNVYDADGDSLTYSFSPDSTSPAGFKINTTNGIVSYSIDYDVDDTLTNVTSFVWLITIADPDGLAATATLTVSILDANDNVPDFDSNYYSASVASNALVGTVALSVSASDKDLTSENRELTYSIHSTDLFRIDDKGNVVVYKSLLTYADTIVTFSIRVKNPDVNTYSGAAVNIFVYTPSSGGFFDDSANVAWVTLTCILAPLILAALAFLVYRYWIKPDASAFKPPQQVAPYETKMPPSRHSTIWSSASKSRPTSQRTLILSPPVTPSDIRVIESSWRAWGNGGATWDA